jgi:predicted metal-dependent hydrolase
MTALPSESPPGEAITAEEFKAEVAAWAQRLGVSPQQVTLRPMQRKWGSCSSNGRLTFDTGLLREPGKARAEVIVHELLHLRIPNHSPLFRSLLRAYLAQGRLS